MSPIFLRTWYQVGGTSFGGVDSRSSRMMVVSPGLEKLRILSTYGVSCSLRSSLSVTCWAICTAVAPGQRAEMTIARKVNGGSSSWPSCW
jgi:hypothetical protein